MESGKPGPKGFLRFTHTIRYSISGFKYAWKYEESFRQEMVLSVLFTPLAFFVGQSSLEIIALISSLCFLLIVELLNSSIEAVVDRVGLEKHELSKRAKDMASTAVMLTLFMAIGVWATIAIKNFLL
jgi:diacylglycerol kinase (ATP)